MRVKRYLNRVIGISAIVCCSALSSWAAADEAAKVSRKNSFGAGFGLTYGILGFSYDRQISPLLALTTSIGLLPFVSDSVINIGLKYKLGKSRRTWQPRVFMLAGHNAWADYDCSRSGSGCGYFEAQSYFGLTAGIGQAWVFGQKRAHSLDFDILVRVYSWDIDSDRRKALAAGGEVDEVAHKASFSMGYRYHF